DRAGAANAVLAADMGAGLPAIVADGVDQRLARLDPDRVIAPVNGKRDVDLLSHAPISLRPRPEERASRAATLQPHKRARVSKDGGGPMLRDASQRIRTRGESLSLRRCDAPQHEAGGGQCSPHRSHRPFPTTSFNSATIHPTNSFLLPP